MAKHRVFKAAAAVGKALAGLTDDEKEIVRQLVATAGGAVPAKRKYRKRASKPAKRSVGTLRKQLKKNADKTTPPAKGKTRPAQLVDD